MKTKKKLPYLDYLCVVGEKVCWKNIKREYFEGIILEMNSETCIAKIKLDNGEITDVKY
jgi:hypothetical protein